MSTHQRHTLRTSAPPSYRVKSPISEVPRGQSSRSVLVSGMAKTVKTVRAMKRQTVEGGSVLYNIPGVDRSDSLIDMIARMKDVSQSINQESSTASICEKGTASLMSLSDVMKANKCNRSIRSVILTHKLMNELQGEAMKAFVTAMKSQQERRKRLDQQTREFETRRSNFRQIIIENINKINRQHEVFKAMRSEYTQCRETLHELIIATRSVRNRCAILEQKIEALQPVEKFLLDAVECLPEDYVSKSHDPLRSLMLRYQSLIEARNHLLKAWEEKQAQFEKELVQSTAASRDQKQVVIKRVANVHDVLGEADGLYDQIQHSNKTVDGEKAGIALQLNEFNMMSRSIRNITAKCVDMLKDLEYHQPLPSPPEKTRLCDCLQLIEFLHTIVEGIKKELIASESVTKMRRMKNERNSR